MLVDGRSVPGGSIIGTDVCVVGAGPAGITLALRLAALARVRVVLLESGGLAFEPGAQSLARGETVGMPYYPLHETRIRLLGGSSQSWGGVCAPVEREALEARPWLGLDGWPICAGSLDAYNPAAIGWCGVDAAQQARNLAAHDVRRNAWPLDADAIEPLLVQFSRPLRFGVAYRDELMHSERVTTHLHAAAVELLAGPGASVVSGVRVRSPGGGEYQVRARQVVLAGGGIENNRLLLASRDRDPEGLGNRDDQLGRCFMEHPRLPVRFRVRAGRTPLGDLMGDGAAGTLRFLRLGLARETQRREGLLTWHANIGFGYAGHEGDTWASVRRLAIAVRPPWNESPYFQDAGGGRTRLRSADVGAALRRPHAAALGVLAALRPSPHLRRWIEIYSSTEQRPDSANRIELGPDHDPLGVPRVRIRWGVGEDEARTHRRAVELAVRELERIEPGMGGRPVDAADGWPGAIVGTWHHLGGTRMSTSPRSGMVDPDLRLHGVPNVSVVGGSVFPTGGSTSPTVTIVALALRLADRLAVELGAPAVEVRAVLPAAG